MPSVAQIVSEVGGLGGGGLACFGVLLALSSDRDCMGVDGEKLHLRLYIPRALLPWKVMVALGRSGGNVY